MKNSLSYLIFLSIALFCMTIQILAIGSKMFGPYRVITRSIDKCQLPIPVDKNRECINNLTVQKISRTKELINGIVIIPQDIPYLRGTVYVDLWRDGGYKPFVNKKFNNACDELLVGPIIKTYLTTKKNCLVVQGNYTFAKVDPNIIARTIIGENFFYDKVLATVALSSKEGLVFCIRLSFESMPLFTATQGGKKSKRA